ncbi:hypothetical protein QWI17_15880 [Gilvimarinus sp. SDUM040013]|uniref:Glycosyltransferase 2-like domain-containing protein n=1 Tax=Gilvimarinus gilvus TaxID=3058038 RepID=A0ABU4RVW3_9GAMM|nr:hypothetical protein [Gilvimarinus sp. SDUM040013]MDO3387321.1 hypothetical protein [Gilvimarinus sp. SDUM040013]MDX6849010.1 hypothetical protein [Gilvimarinus sp. SDUM040013]
MQSAPTNAHTKYIAVPFFSWPLHEGERLVLAQNGSQAQPVHETLAQTLMLCDQWRSLEEHLDVTIKKMPQLQAHALQLHQGLLHLISLGLLVDADSLSQNFAAPPSSTPAPEGIKTLYVRTYCCPQALERLFQSALTGRAGASLQTLVVIDDAREESDIARTRVLLNSYRAKLPADLIHITRADRNRLADALAEISGAEAQDLRWWLNGDPNDPEMTAGATFNTALLLSAGTKTAVIDDDGQLTPYGDATDLSQMSVASTEHVDWTMYSSPEDMEDAWSVLDLDPLKAHSQWLGQSLSTAIEQTSKPETFWQSISRSGLANLKPNAKVKVSVNGLLGDPGTGGGSWLLGLPPEKLTPCLESEEHYRQLTSSRLLARHPQGQKLLPWHSLLSPLVGIDNSELMPPTFPNGRGEDVLFADLVCCVYPESLFAQLPWMLKHIPEHGRQYDRDALSRPARISTSRLLSKTLRKLRHAVPSASPNIRLQWLGQSLQAIAEIPTSSLTDEYYRHLAGDRAHWAKQLIKNLQTLNPPAYLAEDMQQLLNRLRQGIETDRQDLDAINPQIRRYSSRYGEALTSWQLAWEHCHQLGEPQTLNMLRDLSPEDCAQE